ncbi:MAG: protein BatD [Bacteroidales bacterium]|nr:protein BatD [Bacteroidales bacterium]
MNIFKTKTYQNITFRALCLALMLVISVAAVAQNARITASAPNTVSVGQRFNVKFSVNAEHSNFKPPSFKGLNYQGGPFQSFNQSSQNINGRQTSSLEISYTYTFSATSEGKVTIGSATCVVEGNTISSSPVTITVEKGNPAQNQQQRQSNNAYNQQPQQQQSAQAGINDKSLFVRAVANKGSAYQGEEVIVTYKLYTQVQVRQFQIDKLPSNKGFWSEDLTDDTKNPQQREEVIDGRRYAVYEIRKIALFPQETGTLTLSPINTEVAAVVQVQSNRRQSGNIFDIFFDDPFFGGSQYQVVNKKLKSNTLSINVKSLPDEPDGYFGAVGDLSVKSSVDTKKLKANEALTYSLTISGKGNLMLIDNVDVDFPPSFEVYDPKVSSNIKRSAAGISGSKTFEWVLIPRSQGQYTIPAAKLVCFNPKSKTFVTKTTGEFTIDVAKGEGGTSSVGDAAKNNVKLLNNDIEYIKTGNPGLHKKGTSFFGGALFWILFLLPVILAIAAVIIIRKVSKSNADINAVRLRKATKLAKKRLRKAEKFLADNDDERFYIEIYQAIWGYVSDKFTIPTSQLSSETIQGALESKNVSENVIQTIMQTIGEVDFARFAPGDSASKKQSIYNQALQMILDLENQLK